MRVVHQINNVDIIEAEDYVESLKEPQCLVESIRLSMILQYYVGNNIVKVMLDLMLKD